MMHVDKMNKLLDDIEACTNHPIGRLKAKENGTQITVSSSEVQKGFGGKTWINAVLE